MFFHYQFARMQIYRHCSHPMNCVQVAELHQRLHFAWRLAERLCRTQSRLYLFYLRALFPTLFREHHWRQCDLDKSYWLFRNNNNKLPDVLPDSTSFDNRGRTREKTRIFPFSCWICSCNNFRSSSASSSFLVCSAFSSLRRSISFSWRWTSFCDCSSLNSNLPIFLELLA